MQRKKQYYKWKWKTQLTFLCKLKFIIYIGFFIFVITYKNMNNIEFIYKNKLLLEEDLKKNITLQEEKRIRTDILSLEKWINDMLINNFNSILFDTKIEDKFTAISEKISPYIIYSNNLYNLITLATMWLCDYNGNKNENEIQKTYIIYHKVLKRYKIWRTLNIKKRLQAFSLWVEEIDIIHIINYDIENKLHKKFKEKQISWEWFDLNSEDIKYIKNIT